MISEITFSRKFTSFWNQLLPNANNYVRLVNGCLLETLYEPQRHTDNKENIALINEISFNLYTKIVNGKLLSPIVFKNEFYQSKSFSLLVEEVKYYLLKFTYGSKFLLPFNQQEINSIKKLTFNLLDYFKNYSNIVIAPEFKGCGFIHQVKGDVYADSKLIEIKAGDRYFKVIDFRQILVYCTLNFYSNDRKTINEIKLFNPRVGIAFSTDVHSLCKNLAALLPEEVFYEIKTFVTEHDFIAGALTSNLA
ncbi:hypothetical protein [Snodgrassella sp.]|uniref:hypothetical protein n=1 Tax=Snodgrassella sp. TaxID=2815304 RepID=UPI00258F89C7|nr:hypothetical protein [Snodgrassella sp.]MCO6525510.1 hypothetical protein [Snodgrassella sp.]